VSFRVSSFVDWKLTLLVVYMWLQNIYIYFYIEYSFLFVLMRKKSERSSRGGPQAVPGGAKPCS
jgi:hypothetical protein